MYLVFYLISVVFCQYLFILNLMVMTFQINKRLVNNECDIWLELSTCKELNLIIV